MLNNLQERFQCLTPRERVIVVVTILAALWGSWDHFFYQSVALKQATLKQELISLNKQISSQQEITTQLEVGGNIDPNADNQNKLNKLKAHYGHLQDQVMQGNKKFVPPSLMAKALNDMLKQNQELTLIKLSTLPVTTLLAEKQQNFPIYKHGLVMTFTGKYTDTLNYLKTLENLPWAIIWESFDYQVKEFPMAEITVHIVTLSFEKDWLGV